MKDRGPLWWLTGWDVWILIVGFIVVALLASCAHFPVHEGQCPFVSQGGYGVQHVLDASDAQCKIRCLQELSNNCHLFGPEVQ